MNSGSMSPAPVVVAFICDDGYVVPTCVAITSLLESKNEDTVYDIHIVCASLSEENESIFRQFERERVTIHIIRQNAERFVGLHAFQEGAYCVATPAALLKFVLPELLSDYDKVLYLDGDLLVREDLTALYATDLGDAYLAAIVDSGSLYLHNQFIDCVQNYFNSGVMLLNLAGMRRDNLTETLIRTKMELNDSNLMDQNVFNCVCDGKMIPLSVRYNFQPLSLIRAAGKWTVDQINERYGTDYCDESSLFADAAIVHFSSKDKPWKDDSVAFVDDWYHCYFRAPVAHTLVRTHQAEPDEPDVPKVSVIIPVYNVEAYLEETLESMCAQTLKDLEIICIDDGSTDHSLQILEAYAKKDARIRVYHQENQGQGKARNAGLDLARGTYIHFMDSDDLLDADALQRCYESAVWNNLDVVMFDGDSFYESAELEALHPQYRTFYHRRKFYPGVYTGEDIYIRLSRNWDFIVSACMKLYRRAYLQENQIRFPEKIRFEDNFFAFHSVIAAARAKVLCYAPYHRRVRDNSSMTDQRDIYQKYVGYHETACLMLDYLNEHSLGEEAVYAVAHRVNQFLTSANGFYLQLSDAQREYSKCDYAVRRLDYTMLAPILALHKANFFSYADSKNLHRYRSDCESLRKDNHKLREEKRVLWEELQKLRKERGERWNELQALYKLKSERWAQLQTLYKERDACRRELQTIKQENADLRTQTETAQTQISELQKIYQHSAVYEDGTIVLKVRPKIARMVQKIVSGIKNIFTRLRRG